MDTTNSDLRHDSVPSVHRTAKGNKDSRRIAWLYGIADAAKSPQELFVALFEYLSVVANAKTMFRLAIDHSADGEADLTILGNQLSEVPVGLEQWATTVGLRAIMLRKPDIEYSTNLNSEAFTLVAIPFDRSPDQRDAFVALFCDSGTQGTLETAVLQAAASVVQHWDTKQKSSSDRLLAIDSSALIGLGSKLESSSDVESATRTIAKLLDSQIKSYDESSVTRRSKVLVGSVIDHRATLVAVSDADTLPTDETLVEAIESAMAECLCRNSTASWPALNGDRHALLCHQRLAKGDSIYRHLSTTLLEDGYGDRQAVVMLASDVPFSDRQLRFAQAASLVWGAKLELIQRAERNWLQRSICKLSDSFRTAKFRFIATLVGVCALLAMIPMPSKVACDCELRPSTKRFVCAPFASPLRESFVDPGDFVVHDQVLATLDDREIRLKLAENNAEVQRAQKDRDGFLASHESGQARLAQLEIEALKAKNKLLSTRIQNLELKSPIDGVVVAGDLKNAVGMPLETGSSLFEVAPLEQLIVEVFVREDEVRFTQAGMKVSIGLDSLPYQRFYGKIKQLSPSAEIVDGESVFVAKVELKNEAGALRPGMQGIARISTRWRPIGWTYLHKPIANCLRWLGW